MSNIIGDGVGWLTEQLESSSSDLAVYRRGDNSTAVNLTRGRSEYSTFDDEGNLVTQVTDADFLCHREKLILNGKHIEPVSGDRIEIKGGTETFTYQVVPHGDKRCFSIDQSRNMLRIHTKLIKTQ